MCFPFFYVRAASVHLAALRRGSSVYVATETFIYEHAGKTVMFTTLAILREVYDVAVSPCYHSTSMTALEAAQYDLEFDFIVMDLVVDPSLLDDWLYEQLLIEYLDSERRKSAIWDLSRLPAGSHLSDSKTFRWLKRDLLPLDTRCSRLRTPYTVSTSDVFHLPRFGRQVIFHVQSGSDDYQLRRFHRVQAAVKFIKTPARVDMFGYLEPVRQHVVPLGYILAHDPGLSSCSTPRSDPVKSGLSR